MARRPTRPTPEPLDVDAVSVVTVGTALWGLAALVLALFVRGWLERNNDVWWIWTCVSGFVLGLAGIAYVRRRRTKLGRLGAARGEQPPASAADLKAKASEAKASEAKASEARASEARASEAKT